MKKIRCLLCLPLILCLFCGCSHVSNSPADPVDARHLKITATVEEGLGFTSFPAEDLNSNLTEDLTYLDLKDVTIKINDDHYPLEDAIRQELITVEEIFAYARLDARDKICGETFETEHGLTHFTYCYPEFYLHLVYDVFESPDGKAHLISDITLYQPGSNIGYFYVDKKTGTPLFREDWGLTLEPADVSPTGLTLNITQSGGQQIGALQAESYTLFTEDYSTPVPELPGNVNTAQDAPIFVIAQNAQSQYTIDWTNLYGKLPKGNYVMTLHVHDIFDASQIHPLMEDFSDRQYYDIPFRIF